jgi:hypothetical protein
MLRNHAIKLNGGEVVKLRAVLFLHTEWSAPKFRLLAPAEKQVLDYYFVH